ncbi:RNA methyltransferase [Spirulina major CS-329]|nr:MULTISPECIES: RNA methyltransferase [Spirulina]MDB9496379.1 RNA methyltransferase [Spirulina subsalsa CS-330]MDB9504698.1 RNA methyltransferase [Spirulina major CS-329]
MSESGFGMGLEQIRIVLVEPAGPLNVGSVARVMKNMGLSRLVLVNPHCDRTSPEAYQMAVHAAEILDQAQIVATLPDAVQGCDRAVATAGRDCNLTIPLEPPRHALPWLRATPGEAALIFGREDRGLTNEELNLAQRAVMIPANPAYPSLNLAQAVAICTYELTQAAIAPSTPTPAIAQPTAPLDHLNGYYTDLETLLLDIGYLMPHTAAARMTKLRRLYNRAMLTPEEVALLRGMIRQTRWALRQGQD